MKNTQGGATAAQERKYTMYKVIDWYEGYTLIGIYKTLTEAKRAAKEFANDTDSECNIEIVKENIT